MPWTSLCELTELRDGEGKYVEAGGYQLAVFLHDGIVHVLDNYCPHAGANLAGGWINAGCVVCPKHGWPFHLENGQLRDNPAVAVDIYPVRLVEQAGETTLVQILLPDL